MSVFCSFLGFYLLVSLIEWKGKHHRFSRRLLSFLVCLWILTLFSVAHELPPSSRLFASCVGTLWLLKIVVRSWGAGESLHGTNLWIELLYRFVWPGMSMGALKRRSKPLKGDGDLFVRGYISFLLGLLVLIALSLLSPYLGDLTLGLLGILPFFLLLHFGYALLLPAVLRLLHVPAPLLFESPLTSLSLHEFWSIRWNKPFVEMNRVLFFRPASQRLGRDRAILLTFFASGLFHELGISYPAGGGWGLPTLYFLLHAGLVAFEGPKSRRLQSWPKSLRRIWVYAALLLPLPLLFHCPFRSTLVIPFFRQAGELLRLHSVEDYFSWLLFLAGLGHFLVLLAGIQVPFRLDWKNDLKKLNPFNEKIMWNYGLFIFLIIAAFGAETLLFQKDMLAGIPSALGMAALIGFFWLLRILVDCFYFSHSDWPEGPEFIIGHALLNSLFLFLTSTFLGLLLWHWFS